MVETGNDPEPVIDGRICYHRGRQRIYPVRPYQVKNPDIKEGPSSNLAYEIPVDANEGRIRSLILEAYTIDQIQSSGLGGVYDTIMEEIGSNALKAHKRLSRYGVSLDDIIQVLLKALKVKDRNSFIRYLKEKSQEKPPR